MRLSGVLLAILALTTATAQNAPQTVLIQGIAIDKASRTPVVGATVRGLAITNGNIPNLPATKTDSGGHFEMNVPGGVAFTLMVSANGYQDFRQSQPLPDQNNIFIEVAMDRLAEIRGRLVDDESRKPVAGIGITLIRPGLMQAGNALSIGAGLTTKDDGSFVIRNLTREDYYLRIQGTPQAVLQEIPSKQLEGEAREKTLQVPEPVEGYGIVVWPGEGSDVSQTPPIHVVSDVMDVGDIRLRRYKLHNLSGVLGDCGEGDSLQVLLMGKNGSATARLADLDTTCGSGFRILNLSEGTFSLVAQGGPPRRFISEAIDGATRGPLLLNVATAVTVQILVEVEGMSPGAFPEDIKRVKIALTPESVPVKIDSPDQVAPDEYEAHVFGNERYRLSATPPANYYLKLLSYNGVSLPDQSGFSAVAGALSTLRLILSNRPGAVEAQAPANSFVYLVAEGAKFGDIDTGDKRMFQRVAGGKAIFAGLKPGTYRAFAVNGIMPSSQGTLDDALRHSTTVTVDDGQTVRVTLDVP